jgi:acyl-CoA reductase-like NAD-dependent aldehyde dehydrogenase
MSDQEFPLFIGGKAVPGTGSFAVIDPATGEAFAECALASTDQLDEAVDAARAAFPAWAAMPIEDRAAPCLRSPTRSKSARRTRSAALARTEQAAEIGDGRNRRHALLDPRDRRAPSRHRAGRRIEGDRRTPSSSARRRRVDHPVEFPGHDRDLARHPALLAGNSVVIKPSPNTPLTTLRVVAIANEHLSARVFNAVTGDVEIGGAMSRHPGIDKIVFTGSTPPAARSCAKAPRT